MDLGSSPPPRNLLPEQTGGESLTRIASAIAPKPDPRASTSSSSQPTSTTHQPMHPQQLDLPVASDSSIPQRDASPNSSTNTASAPTLPVPQPALSAGSTGTSSDILTILNTFSQLPLEQRRALFPVLGTLTETPQPEAPMRGDDAPPSYSD
jgi:hypothetical protein